MLSVHGIVGVLRLDAFGAFLEARYSGVVPPLVQVAESGRYVDDRFDGVVVVYLALRPDSRGF